MENLEFFVYYLRVFILYVFSLINIINIFDYVSLHIDHLISYTYLFIIDSLFLTKNLIVFVIKYIKLYHSWFVFNEFFFWIFFFVTINYVMIILFCYFNVISLSETIVSLYTYIETQYNDFYKIKKMEWNILLNAKADWLPKIVIMYIYKIKKVYTVVYVFVSRVINRFLFFVDKFGFLLILIYIVIYVFIFYYQFDCFSSLINVVTNFDLLLFLNSCINLGNWIDIDIDELLKVIKRFFKIFF